MILFFFCLDFFLCRYFLVLICQQLIDKIDYYLVNAIYLYKMTVFLVSMKLYSCFVVLYSNMCITFL